MNNSASAEEQTPHPSSLLSFPLALLSFLSSRLLSSSPSSNMIFFHCRRLLAHSLRLHPIVLSRAAPLASFHLRALVQSRPTPTSCIVTGCSNAPPSFCIVTGCSCVASNSTLLYCHGSLVAFTPVTSAPCTLRVLGILTRRPPEG